MKNGAKNDTENIEWRQAMELLTKLLTPNPKKRPDAKEALKTDFCILDNM
jgi:serine/threonine protein kinase